MHLRCFVVPVILTFMFISAPAVKGAQAPAPLASSTVLHADVNLVLLDIVVSDHDKPVHGLERSRFHVFEDKREQAIASFDEHRPPAAIAPGSMPPMKRAALAPNTFTNISEYPDAGAVNVLLLDGLNTPFSDQINIRLKMIEYIGKIKPGTSLAIFGLSAQLRMISGFSTDLGALSAALKSRSAKGQLSTWLDSNAMAQQAGTMPTSLAETVNDNGTPLTGFQANEASAVALAREFTGRMTSFQLDQRVLMTLDALQQLARYLSGIPGRKNIIWFSGSFPNVIAREDKSGNLAFDSERSYVQQIRETTELLTHARVSIYPIDARGTLPPSLFNAANTTAPVSQTDPISKYSNSTPFAQKLSEERSQTIKEHDTMQQVADDTGGKAFYETNDFTGAVADVVENGSSYYTIGYVPEKKKSDGQFHTFKVSVDQGSYKLAYRRGYYADEPDKPSTHASGQPDPMAAAALHGAPPSTQIPFTAQVAAATDPLFQGVKLPTGPAGEGSATLKAPVRYVVNFTLSPGALSLDTARDGTRTGRIDFVLVAYDGGGNRVNSADRQIQLTIRPELLERVTAKGISVPVAIDLPAGENSLRIVVSDLGSDRTGSLEVPVAVASK